MDSTTYCAMFVINMAWEVDAYAFTPNIHEMSIAFVPGKIFTPKSRKGLRISNICFTPYMRNDLQKLNDKNMLGISYHMR